MLATLSGLWKNHDLNSVLAFYWNCVDLQRAASCFSNPDDWCFDDNGRFDDVDVLFPSMYVRTRGLQIHPFPSSLRCSRHVWGYGPGRQLFADTTPQLISSVCLFWCQQGKRVSQCVSVSRPAFISTHTAHELIFFSGHVWTMSAHCHYTVCCRFEIHSVTIGHPGLPATHRAAGLLFALIAQTCMGFLLLTRLR